MTPADLVLQTMRTRPERWSLAPHRKTDPADYKLALEIVERLLPARYNAQPTIAGRPLPAGEFPLTMSFIVRAARLAGIKLGQKHAYRVRLEALTILQHKKIWPRRARYSLTLYQLRLNPLQRLSRTTPISPTASLDSLSAKTACQASTEKPKEERGPPKQADPAPAHLHEHADTDRAEGPDDDRWAERNELWFGWGEDWADGPR